MLQLERWDAATLGCGAARGKHGVLPGMLFPWEQGEQGISVGLQEIPPRRGEGPEGGLAGAQLVSPKHLPVVALRGAELP